MLRHSYDATSNKWISNTGTTPASGAAADLRLPQTSRDAEHIVLRFPLLASRPPSVPHARTEGTLAVEILDGLKVIVGMLSLACVAMFLLVLA